jgi:drug/metabolite transporter (DMT)-like permease
MPNISTVPLRTVIVGLVFACLSTILGGTTVALTRLIIHQTDPLSLSFTRYGMGAIALLVFLYPTLKQKVFSRQDAIGMAALGIVMFSGFPYFMALGLEFTTAAHGGLIFSTMPLMTLIIAVAVGVERLTGIKLAAVALGIVGIVIALGEQLGAIAPNALQGDIYFLIGVMGTSMFNVFSKRYIALYGSLPVLTYTMAVGSLFMFVLALFLEQPFSGSLNFDVKSWAIVVWLGVPGAALMVYLWCRALAVITPTQVSITIGLNTLTAMLGGVWLMDETLSPRIWIGFAMILGAIALVSLHRPKIAVAQA